MPDPLDLGDLCELRDRLPSRAQALALPEDISVHEFLQVSHRLLNFLCDRRVHRKLFSSFLRLKPTGPDRFYLFVYVMLL